MQALVEKVLTHRPRARRGMFHIEPVHLLHRFFVFWSFALGLVVDGVAAEIIRLHESKRALSDSILEGAEQTFRLTSQEMLEMLSNQW